MTRIKPEQEAVRIVHFTDTHLFADRDGRLLGVDTNSTFEQVLALSGNRAASADMLLLTGDLSQDETAASYQTLARSVTQLKVPAYFLPGNHDDNQIMKESLSDGQKWIGEQKSVTLRNWQIILLDSTVKGRVGGYLSKSELERLHNELARADAEHALVCLHHQPVPVGSAWIDSLGLENQPDFWEVIDKHSNVRGVLWGHVHQEFRCQRGSVLLLSTPSTCVQFKPGSASFAVDERLPGYRWLNLLPDGRIETAVERLENVSIGVDPAASGY